MSDLDLEYKADKVTDELSFISFIKLLIERRKIEIAKLAHLGQNELQEEVDPWANLATEDFLRVMIAWSEETLTSSDFYQKPSNPWTRFANMIFVGLISEYKG